MIYNFESFIAGKNVHSILMVCPNCGMIGTNLPLEKTCGNCNYSECLTYYDAETIDKYFNEKETERG